MVTAFKTLFVAAVLAAPAVPEVTSASDAGLKADAAGSGAADLAAVRRSILTAYDLAEAGIITDAQAQQAVARYQEKANAAVGRDIGLTEILAAEGMEQATAPAELTALQRFAGLITLVNVLWVLAIILGVVCFTYLAGGWVVELIKMFANIPLKVWEALFLLLGAGVALYGLRLSPEVGPYVGFTGCLLFGGGLAFLMVNHDLKERVETLFVVHAAVTGLLAVLYGSQLVGFLAVTSLMGALGFSVAVLPGCYMIGFESDKVIARATVAALGILALFCGIEIAGASAGVLGVFRLGSLWMGSFVGFLGLLILSSKWYDDGEHYPLMQAVVAVAGIAALTVGSVWHISELQRIGGTFFVLWAVEKVLEIPVKSMKGYAYLGLCVSGLLYAGFMVVKAYPDLIGPYLLF